MRTRPTSCDGREVDDADQPELGVDVDDRTVRGERERHVRVALTVVVERMRELVVVLLGRLEGLAGDELDDREIDRAVATDDAPVDDVELDRRLDVLVRRPGPAPAPAPPGTPARTAPPDIHVWRLAEVEPAEPIEVSAGASTTSSTPRTSRAICWASVTKPCPTSAPRT